MTPRLLLVDDEPRNLSLLEAFLAPQGYAITKAGSGREAIELFEREPPDLMLLDVLMPDLNGIDVLTHIRAHEEGVHVPVILVTGQTERSDRLRGFEAGADEFLEKPVDRDLLLMRVRTLLQLKQARDEIASRNAQLEQLQRAQRELTAFIVHDLNNPLSIIHLNVDWMRHTLGTSDPDLVDAMNDALTASKRLQKMINDLLEISRFENMDEPLRCEAVALDELLAGVARAQAREAAERHITVHVGSTTGLCVSADRAILQRVIENLLRNALRYTPAGGKIGLSAQGGSEIRISVSNTGAPIPEHERAHIFEKFRRGKGEGAKSGHAGLGLYFCARAMEAQRGMITVTQTPEWPASFVLHFPVA